MLLLSVSAMNAVLLFTISIIAICEFDDMISETIANVRRWKHG